jgi:hypothetical protein
MRSTTLFPNGLRDLMIGLIALILAVMIWSIVMVPVAI